jgi:hypothetical protein
VQVARCKSVLRWLQGTGIYACYFAYLLQACSYSAEILNVLGQTAVICDEDHASSPLL